MAHFNHVRELTPIAQRSLDLLQKHGAITVNQTPLIGGVNDSSAALLELFNKLSFMGVPPYYVFQCRPTEGNKSYSVPIEEGYEMFRWAQSHCSGLAKRARFCMSHVTGKIEVAALTEDQIVFKYHQAADPRNVGRVMIFDRNPEAHWFDDYAEAHRFQPAPAPVNGDFVLLETTAGHC
jgi:L-lysine 2,3-aminomutase